MDSLTGLILSILALAVWAYVTYFAVRRGIRDGMEDRALSQKGDSAPPARREGPESSRNP